MWFVIEWTSDYTSSHGFRSLQAQHLSRRPLQALAQQAPPVCREEGTSRFTGISSPTSCGESRTTGSRKTLKDTKQATFYSSGRSRPQPLSGRSQAPSRWCCWADNALSGGKRLISFKYCALSFGHKVILSSALLYNTLHLHIKVYYLAGGEEVKSHT